MQQNLPKKSRRLHTLNCVRQSESDWPQSRLNQLSHLAQMVEAAEVAVELREETLLNLLLWWS